MNVLSRQTLIEATQAGFRPKYLFFWGHRASDLGHITATCLSQWWPSPFEVGGETFATAEHYMMAGKARLFGDETTRAAILKAGSPAQAKKLGRKVTPFDGATWDAHRMEIVTAGNVAKFGQDPALKAFLIGTGQRVLVEASPVDRIWGIGLRSDDRRAQDPQLWRGENLLGFALMAARQALVSGGA